ncbi:MAG: hypothetical protein GVY29_04845, partial [Spirochaetes bacterium]|nr:hypothetical protein [Spirochaetota bacterium]
MTVRSLGVLVFVLLFVSVPTFHVLSQTWDGGNGTTNWNDGANWDTDTVPTDGDAVDIPDVSPQPFPSIDGGLPTGGDDFASVTIRDGAQLDLNGFTFVDTGALTVERGATLDNSGGAVTVPAASATFGGAGAGAITFDSAGIAVTVTGATTIDLGAGNSIILDNAGNDFQGDVSISSGANVTIQDTTALQLGASAIGGDLDVTAGGQITDSGNISVTGAGIFDAGANAITLGDTTTADFGDLTVTGA